MYPIAISFRFSLKTKCPALLRDNPQRFMDSDINKVPLMFKRRKAPGIIASTSGYQESIGNICEVLREIMRE